MALQTSGPISLNDIHVEAGGSSGTSASINDTDIRGLTPASGKTINDSSGTQIDFFNFYGATAETSLPTSGSTINGQVQLKQISASTYISSGGTLRVPSNMWVWTDSTSTAALTIDIPCTVINDGKIIGQGGNGGSYYGNLSPTAGGPAINVTSSGVTITNSSGAYIAGGGGGGGKRQDVGDPQDSNAGGGGGAGGGTGGRGWISSHSGENAGTLSGVGGVLNAEGSGSYHRQTNALLSDNGGGAGGGSGGTQNAGGGGGRILPGSGGVASSSFSWGTGGSAGNAGTGNNPTAGVSGHVWAGGGGGWGASGGNGVSQTAASGGAAITGTSRTLSNSGTIYGST